MPDHALKPASRLTIIIVSYNTRTLLRNCLDSLRQEADPDTEVIVVDNHSSDGSAEMVAREFSDVHLIQNRENCGFAQANNLGIREAAGKYLLLLNSDTIVRPGAVIAMSDFLGTHAEAGGVTCRLLNGDGGMQACVSRRPGPLMLLFRLSGLSALVRSDRSRRWLRRYLGWLSGATVRSYLEPYAAGKGPAEVENISAACLMLRRDAILDVGLLDENFFMYFEDIDYCLRLRQAGWRLYYLRDGEIVHLVGQSSGGRMRNYSVHSYRSLFYFYRKHYSIYCLGLAKAMVWSLSGLRWLWNLGSGWMSGDRIHAQNRQDLRSIMNLCWSEPEDAAPSYRVALKTFEQHGLAPEKIHGTASLSGGKK